jgi:peptidoglycan/LPS O-acetylase OafA/YrhL
MFLFGSLCFEQKIFDVKPKKGILYNLTICIWWIPILLYHYFYINAAIRQGEFVLSKTVDTLILWFMFHISLICIMYIIIRTFYMYLNKPGKAGSLLNRNSYSVYIIHVVVMGGVAIILLKITLPSLLKFILLTLSTYFISNVLFIFYRKVIQKKLLLLRKRTL